MPMRMNSLPAIPEEIRQLIGAYLDKQTIATVIQVSRSLHASFVPLLWKQAELRGGYICSQWGGDHMDSGAGKLDYASSCLADFSNSLPSPPPSPGLHSSSSSPSPPWMMDLILLQARSRHIEHLTISAPIPSDYYTIHFPRLKTLVLTDDYTTTGSPQNITQLARLNPTIERLIIKNIQTSLPAQFWETVSTDWKTPRSLCIRYSSISKESAAALWRASTRFEDLELRGVDLPHYATFISSLTATNSDDDEELSSTPSVPMNITTFPNAKRVHLSITPRQTLPFFNPPQQLAMMQSCPQLRELVWDGSHFHIDPQLSSQFTTALHPSFHPSPTSQSHNSNNSKYTCWPHLESLVLLHISPHSRDPLHRRRLAEIIHAVPALKALQIRGGVWESLAMNALRTPGRHFETLERVSVRGCKGFSSSMVQEVLMNCKGLVELCADFIYAQDVVPQVVAPSSAPDSASGLGVSGVQPWACQGLKRLKICIYATPLSSSSSSPSTISSTFCTARQVLVQLATLTKLEHLDLRRNLVDERPLLNLTIASGLNALSAITRLRTFRFDDCCSLGGRREGRDGWMMGEEEMVWMLRRWKELEKVSGPFRGMSTMMGEDKVRGVFKQRHVEYSSA